MAGPKARMTIEGIEELQRKLRDPRMIQEPLRELLDEASALGQRVATDAIEGGRGLAVRSMGRHVDPLSAKVYTMLPRPRALSIEKGRRPGVSRREILAQIISWAEAVGHPKSAYEIVAEIKERGTKGKRFMEQARAAVAETLPRLVARMARRVEELAGR